MKERGTMKRSKKIIRLDGLEVAVIVLALVVTSVATNMISFYRGTQSASPDEADLSIIGEAAQEVELIAADETHGEIGNDIYTIEMWDGGRVKITTMQQYVHQVGSDKLVITDR